MPVKSPTGCRCPLSRSSRVTRGLPSPNDMKATCCWVGEKRGVTTSLSPLVRYLTLAPSMSISARRLRRLDLGPVSSTNTTRLSKKPFSPVTRKRLRRRSDARRAARFRASVVYCWPATCWPLAVSHSRNCAAMRPPSARPTRPVSTNCALTVFQASMFGRASGLAIVFGKRRRVDRAQEHGMGEVVGDHRADRSFAGVARERRHRDRRPA